VDAAVVTEDTRDFDVSFVVAEHRKGVSRTLGVGRSVDILNYTENCE
jgi:hypothetical protein